MIDLTDLAIAAKLPTIGEMLDAGARQTPDRDLIRFDDGTSWTWAEARRHACGAAVLLTGLGLGPGDRVAFFMENRPELLKAWWGASLLGAVVAPLNPSYKGRMLLDAVTRAAPRAIVVSDDRVDLFAGAVPDAPRVPASALTEVVNDVGPDIERPRPWDPHACVFTSGTTGASKASVTTFAGLMATWTWAEHCASLTADDVLLLHTPLFHLSGLSPIVNMMRIGGTIAFRRQPAMTNFWAVARETGATVTMLLGTMGAFLLAQPSTPDERDHGLRLVTCSPLPKDVPGFLERFGIGGIATSFGSTEMGVQIVQPSDEPFRPGSCGRLRAGFEVRIVDEHDFPVPDGQVGEALVRSTSPWLTSQGYLDDDAATVKAWRNGWFHTGDAVRRDEDGYYYFHDRYKDALRRRGENISSFEVEREVLAFPGIEEAACVPAPSLTPGDDEVKVFYTTAPGVTVDLPELVSFLADRMPHFMVPRYLEPIDELPKTATARVQKFKLRDQGHGPATWDREAAGMFLTRDGLVRR